MARGEGLGPARPSRRERDVIVKIEVTEPAYQAIVETLPGGMQANPPVRTPEGLVLVWLDPVMLRKLTDSPAPGSRRRISPQDLMVRLAPGREKQKRHEDDDHDERERDARKSVGSMAAMRTGTGFGGNCCFARLA